MKATLRGLREGIACAPKGMDELFNMSGIVSVVRTVSPDVMLGGRCAGSHAQFGSLQSRSFDIRLRLGDRTRLMMRSVSRTSILLYIRMRA